MNTPRGFQLDAAGRPFAIDPWAAIFNPALPHELAHFLLAALLCAGFVVASIYAVGMLRGRRDRLHRLGFLIPFTVAAIATPLQMMVGDRAVREVVKLQPVKFAAMELLSETATHVPERLGGHMKDGVPTGGLKIPDMASFLTGFHADTKIVGLDTVAPADRPPATIVHLAVRRDGVRRQRAVAARRSGSSSPGGGGATCRARAGSCAPAPAPARCRCVALEAGWVTTEVGRQPWVVYGVLRTAEAVTHAPRDLGIVRDRRRDLRGGRHRPRAGAARDVASLAQRGRRRAPRTVRAARSARPSGAGRARIGDRRGEDRMSTVVA